MRRKGLLFTLDAILALLAATLLLIAIAQVLASLPASSLVSLGLQRLEADALAGMDKNGVLQKAVNDGNSAEIRSFQGILPGNVCAATLVRKHPPGNIVVTHQPACSCNTTRVNSQRAFLRITQAGALETYIATMEGCFR